ncbi:DNA-binding transcriptional regulator, MerR family [Streptomyces sp. AmelKG-D3]|nr:MULTISPECIES: MerR family transcriptional regulator [unclassified Streptomyces]SCK62705.1 DNA-binding transcriptional regulator, MerR family [Streptomyces sp. AmelKG-D3]
MRSNASTATSSGDAAASPRAFSPCEGRPPHSLESTAEWNHGSLSISELAHRCQVSTRSLRYYEEQGLLIPSRNAVGHRRYQAKDAHCVGVIQRLYGAGLPSDLIRTVVQEWKLPDSAPRIEALLRTRHAELSQEAEELHSKLTGLEAVLNVVTDNS